MTKFKIIQTKDPSPYKDQIVNFWDEYLSHTPAERYDWLTEGNPAGKTIWFVAVLEDIDELIGVVTLLPKVIYFNNRAFSGAIMGDLMVHKDHRVFGPTIKLCKAAVNYVQDHNMDFIYTIPNADSIQIPHRVGLKESIELNCYAKLISISYYLNKYLPDFICKITAPLIELFFRLISKETYIRLTGIFNEVSESGSFFDELDQKVRNTSDSLISDHSSAYLKWRYYQNPLNSFRILTYREGSDKGLAGYIVFSEGNDSIEIYDMFCLKNEYVDYILKKIIQIARKKKCRAIYFTVPGKSQWPKKLFSYRFIDAKSRMKVCWMAYNGISLDNWDFFQGDRNI